MYETRDFQTELEKSQLYCRKKYSDWIKHPLNEPAAASCRSIPAVLVLLNVWYWREQTFDQAQRSLTALKLPFRQNQT